MRKIALLTGAAGALLIAAPAMAQEATPPGRNPVPDQTVPTQTPPAQTPPAQTMPATPPAEAAPPAQNSLTLTPGATVRGEAGVELGKLEGARVNAQGQQELTVRGADGQLRSVPLGGLQVNGGEVTVAWSLEQYQAAPAIAAEPAAPAATPPASETSPPTPPVPTLPTDPQPSDPAAPATTTDPMQPDSAAPPPDEDPEA